MLRRCYNENTQRYYTHGARGITVCDSWRQSPDNFVADMGYKPDGYTLDRIDNNGNYCKENCRWASPKEQANNRRSCIYIKYNGETKTIQEWAKELGLTHSALKKRLSRFDLSKAMSPTRYDPQYISKDKRQEILNYYNTSGLSQTKVAKIFNISQAAISKWCVKGLNETTNQKLRRRG